MLFCNNPTDRYFERLMQTVPILRKNERPDNSEITLIMIILDGIRANAESEETENMFKNEKHKVLFEEAVRKKNKKDNALMAVIYLLTSDSRLWNIVKHHIEKSSVDFGSIKLKGIHESGYTLFCGAKDIYTGTRHLCMVDLADNELIPPKIFVLLCNAMAIRRFGIEPTIKKEGTKKDDSGNS